MHLNWRNENSKRETADEIGMVVEGSAILIVHLVLTPTNDVQAVNMEIGTNIAHLTQNMINLFKEHSLTYLKNGIYV